MGDAGLRRPVGDGILRAQGTNPEGNPIWYRWFFQRMPQTGNYHNPLPFNIWLQRYEGDALVGEELMGRWASPLGLFLDPAQARHIQWSPDFTDQLEQLDVSPALADRLRQDAHNILADRASLLSMFMGLRGLELVTLPDRLEFAPDVEILFAIRRMMNTTLTPSELVAVENRNRTYLRTLTESRRLEMATLMPRDFDRLGEPGFHPTAQMFNLTPEQRLRRIETGALPPLPRQSRLAILSGAVLGGLMVAGGLEGLHWLGVDTGVMRAALPMFSGGFGAITGHTVDLLRNESWMPAFIARRDPWVVSAVSASGAGAILTCVEHLSDLAGP